MRTVHIIIHYDGKNQYLYKLLNQYYTSTDYYTLCDYTGFHLTKFERRLLSLSGWSGK